MKTCIRCECAKELHEFSKSVRDPGGLSPYCKNCNRDYQRSRYVKSKRILKKDADTWLCRRCNEVKPAKEFRPRGAECRDCQKARSQYYYHTVLIDKVRIPRIRSKSCEECGISQEMKGFPSGSNVCRMCLPAVKVRRKKERIERDRDKLKDSWFRRKYGITAAQYNYHATLQNNVCLICLKREKHFDKRNGLRRSLAVDHDHETREIRGLLCQACNTALGLFCDDPALLQRAIEYLTFQVDQAVETTGKSCEEAQSSEL